jgi:hypothetical protein
MYLNPKSYLHINQILAKSSIQGHLPLPLDGHYHTRPQVTPLPPVDRPSTTRPLHCRLVSCHGQPESSVAGRLPRAARKLRRQSIAMNIPDLMPPPSIVGPTHAAHPLRLPLAIRCCLLLDMFSIEIFFARYTVISNSFFCLGFSFSHLFPAKKYNSRMVKEFT